MELRPAMIWCWGGLPSCQMPLWQATTFRYLGLLFSCSHRLLYFNLCKAEFVLGRRRGMDLRFVSRLSQYIRYAYACDCLREVHVGDNCNRDKHLILALNTNFGFSEHSFNIYRIFYVAVFSSICKGFRAEDILALLNSPLSILHLHYLSTVNTQQGLVFAPPQTFGSEA